jgi:hypothetical protein
MQIALNPEQINPQLNFEDEIRAGFLQGQSWTVEDEQKHQLLIQGPGSFDNLQDLQWENDSTGSLECEPELEDCFSQRLQATNYSPPLARRKVSFDEYDAEQEDQDLQRALELSMLDQNEKKRTESFDENLSLAIQLSLQEQTYDRKGKGKAAFQ